MADNRLVLLGQLAHLLLYSGKVVLRDSLPRSRHHIIEKAVLHCRAEAELNARIEFLQCLGKQMGRGVPESVLAFFVIELVKCDGRISIDGTVQFCRYAIDTARYNVTGESRRNTLGDLITSHTLFVFTNGAVWESDFNHTTN